MECRPATGRVRVHVGPRACAVALLVTSAVAQPGATGPPPKPAPGPWPLSHVSVWLTPTQYDPVPTLRWLDQQKLQPDRVIVQALDCGMTAFATKSAVLACAPNVAGKDPIGDVGEWAHARGIECWAALDLFRWWQKIEPQAFDPFEKHPELQAISFEQSTDPIGEGKFASPCNPKVKPVLVDVVRELVTQYPDFDGLVLCCRLPEGWMHGFDEGARAAYIRYRQIDPLDLTMYDDHPETRDPEVQQFFNWRLDTVGALLGELVQVFRQAVPKGKVAVVGRGDQYNLTPKVQARTCSDWLTWVAQGYADEVLIDAAWKDESARAAWDAATHLLEKSQRKVPLTCLLTSRPNWWPYGPTEAWPIFAERGRGIDRVAVEGYFARCEDEVKPVLQKTLTWRRWPR